MSLRNTKKIQELMKILLFLFLLPISLYSQNSSLKLWYNRPAANWNEALPIGNGRIGAMIFGTPAIEHLQLNEETIWAGSPNNNANPKAKAALPIVRQLIWEGKYKEAQDLATENIMSATNHGMPYQPMGDLFISFPGLNGYSNYYRDLNISNATATVSYEINGIIYKREFFTSFTDQVLIVRLTASKPASITCNINVTTALEKTSTYNEDKGIVINGTSTTYEKQGGRVKFQTRVKTKTKGGECLANDGLISIENADEAIIYVSIATNFKNYKELTVDQEAKCKNYMFDAFSKDYEQAKAAHIAFFKKYMDRVVLDLGVTDSIKNPTNKRIEQFAKGFDPQLATTYFQYGRYLLICSSQPGTQPANLQGIWNDRLLPSWDCKYTTNINVEMNYWPAEVTNLSELHEPLIQMLKEVAESGSQTAQIMYGARGWVLHHNTDIWRITGAVDGAASGMWPSGGAWLTQHLWYRYLYTGNKEFLASVYPVMKGAAQFFLDFLVEEPTHKWLVVCPSNSPENTHAGSNKKATIAAGVTMDNQLVFDLFSDVIRASEILATDKSFADSVKSARERLAPMQIGQYSQLQEWMNDWDDPKDIHRHISHLYGLFPSNQISPFRTPQLFNAARTSLIFRGDPSTGWSMGWKVCWWARLLDGNHAYKLLTNQLNPVTPTNEGKESGGTYPNMLDAHPPFQIDGNFGCTAGIAEMLMQSHDGFVYILPALPEVWKNGSIKGLVSRGGFVIDISWKNGKLEKLTVFSRIGGNLRLRFNSPVKAGKGISMKSAKNENPNPLFAVPVIKAPIISEKAKLNPLVLPKTGLYDVETEAGKTYEFYGY
jgi:alpha-L-fucosidase 2